MSQKFLVQDISLPMASTLKFLEYIDSDLKVYPLWLCPLRAGTYEKLSPNYIDTRIVVNVGVWGKVDGDHDHFIAINRDLEKKITELKGRKVLYAHAYYPRDEFWKIYDKRWYEDLRIKYDATEVFSDVYDKTHVSEKYRPSLMKGIIDVIKSPFKLPISNS